MDRRVGLRSLVVSLLALVLLAPTVPAAAGSGLAGPPRGSPPPPVPADTLVPNVRILSFKLGSRAPANEPISLIGTGMYRSVDRGVHLLVWRSRNGIVDHVESRRAGSLRLDGHPLSAGYRVFRAILTAELGWKPFGCGGGVRGLMLTGRFGSLTFVLWSRRGAEASISLPSQQPVFGVCGDFDNSPPPGPGP
jgi:hypothetical protein